MKRLGYILIAFALVALHSTNVTALDDAVTDRSLIIAKKCGAAQQVLQTVQRADNVTRINRGNTYDNMSKLMSALSARAALNSYSVPILAEATLQFKALREQFNDQYKDYEIALRELVASDCSAKPQDFYSSLEAIRTQRANLHIKVMEIERQFEQFSQGVTELSQKIKESQ